MRKPSNPNYVKFAATETVVTFATDRGQLRRNDSGEFFYRDLADGKFTCIGEDLERKLIDAGIRAGQPVGITRSTYNRAVIWKVRPIQHAVTTINAPIPVAVLNRIAPSDKTAPPCYAQDRGEAASTAPAPDGWKISERVVAPASPEIQREHSVNTVNGKNARNVHDLPARVYAKLDEPPVLVFPECEPTNSQPAASAARDGQPVPPPTDGGLLGRCLCEALDACKFAHAHATAIGLPVTFDSGDVERMAVSIFIERTTRGSVVDRKPNASAGYVNGAMNQPHGRA